MYHMVQKSGQILHHLGIDSYFLEDLSIWSSLESDHLDRVTILLRPMTTVN